MKRERVVTGWKFGICILCMMFSVPLLLLAEPGDVLWTQTVFDYSESNYYGNDVIQNSDGGFTWVSTARKMISPTEALDTLQVMKTDVNGDIIWVREFDMDGNMMRSFCPTIHQLDDGSYIISGATLTSNSNIGAKFFLLKLDSEGNHIWHQYYGPTSTSTYFALSSKPTPDGGFILAGEVTDMYNTPPDGEYPPSNAFVVKTDSNGDTLWTRELFNEHEHFYYQIYTIDNTQDGNYILSGVKIRTQPEVQGYTQAILIKLDTSGDIIWTQLYGDAEAGSYFSGYTARPTPDGGYAIVGEYFNENFFPGTLLIKTDSTGEVEWEMHCDEDGCAFNTYSLILTNDGGYAISGQKFYEGTEVPEPLLHNAAFILRCNSQGDTVWSRTYCDEFGANSYARQIIQMDDNNLVIAGRREETTDSHTQAILVKIESDLSSVVSEKPLVPFSADLIENHPNPFNSTTIISYNLVQTSPVSITIHDMLGRTVESRVMGRQEPGTHSIEWNAKGLPSGVYFVRLKTDQNSLTRKIVMLK